jgi:hypothetical protein
MSEFKARVWLGHALDGLGIWLARKLSAVAARVYPDGHW